MKTDKNAALKALTCAAMCLPGMVATKQAAAESAPDKATASYRYSDYLEGDLPATDTSPAVPRYDISVHQFLLNTPVASNIALNIGIATESMSGASPMFILPGENGKPVQVMSGATIEESRTDASFGFEQYGSTSKFGFSFGFSNENDYTSGSGAISHSSSFNDNNTSLSLSTGVSFDKITPTGGGTPEYPTRPVEERKQSMSASIGLSQNISRSFVAGASVNYVIYNGFLSDPYKQAFVVDQPIADSRPDVRKQAALNLQIRKYFSSPNAALHADYRYFSTDWGTRSHTLTTAWYQNFGSWQLVPRLRFYDQTAANFYRNYYLEERADGYYSSDYRLSAYQAISLRFKVSKMFSFGALHASLESYDSFSNDKNPITGANPGLVDFAYFSMGFDVQW